MNPEELFAWGAEVVVDTHGYTATLRGTEAVQVLFRAGVEVYGPDGLFIGLRAEAGISTNLTPTLGDALTVAGQNWTLETAHSSDERISRHYLRPVEA